MMAYVLAKGIEPAKSEYFRCVSSEQVYIGRQVLISIAVGSRQQLLWTNINIVRTSTSSLPSLPSRTRATWLPLPTFAHHTADRSPCCSFTKHVIAIWRKSRRSPKLNQLLPFQHRIHFNSGGLPVCVVDALSELRCMRRALLPSTTGESPRRKGYSDRGCGNVKSSFVPEDSLPH